MENENNEMKAPTGPRPAKPVYTRNNPSGMAAYALALRIQGMLGDKLQISREELIMRIYKFMIADGPDNADAKSLTIIRLLECQDVPDSERRAFLRKVNGINGDLIRELGFEAALEAAESAGEYVGGKVGEKGAELILRLFSEE